MKHAQVLTMAQPHLLEAPGSNTVMVDAPEKMTESGKLLRTGAECMRPCQCLLADQMHSHALLKGEKASALASMCIEEASCKREQGMTKT